jgi:hypothetical protein
VATNLSTFTFLTGQGNPTGTADISKYTSIVSTTYNSVSSLTNNILNYRLDATIGDQTVWNLNQFETPQGINYQMSPSNVGQWGSTLMIFNDYQMGGDILLTGPDTFSTANMTNTFDVQMQPNPNTPGYCASFAVYQRNLGTTGAASTIVSITNPGSGSPPPQFGYWRFTIGSNGWISTVQNNPVPYSTTNCNIFRITQDINDVNIITSDNLNLSAGQINLQGQLNLEHFNVQNLTATYGTLQSTTTDLLQASTIKQIETFDPTYPNLIELDYLANVSSVSSLSSSPSVLMQAANFTVNNYAANISTTFNRPTYSVPAGTGNTFYMTSYGAMSFIPTTPGSYPGNWAFGTLLLDFGAGCTIQMSNYGDPTVNGPIVNLSNVGSQNISLFIQGLAGSPYNFMANTGYTITWNGTAYQQPQPLRQWSTFTITDGFTVSQQYQTVEVSTPQIIATNDVLVNGDLQVNGTSQLGALRTFTPTYPVAGIQVVVYTDNPIWSFVEGGAAQWESLAVNAVPKPGGGTYLASEWTMSVSLNGFNPAANVGYSLNAALVTQTIIAGTTLGVSRYLNISYLTPPGAGEVIYTCIMIPKNFIAP